jgi:hypothetical protein
MTPTATTQTPFDMSRSPVNWEPPTERTSLREKQPQLQGRNVQDITERTSCEMSNACLGGLCVVASLVCCVSLGLLIACFVLMGKEKHLEYQNLIMGFLFAGTLGLPLSIGACIGICKAMDCEDSK